MKPPLLLVAGAKGAVGTTVAAAIAAMNDSFENIRPWLITADWANPEILRKAAFAGWDLSDNPMSHRISLQGILLPEYFGDYVSALDAMDVRRPPAEKTVWRHHIEALSQDIRELVNANPFHQPILINLLPACAVKNLEACRTLEEIYQKHNPVDFPDLAYLMAAMACRVPIVNFTSNAVECPLVLQEAKKVGIPVCGRDGKTGQTYLKMVIASALKARKLPVEGWYSLNILGNEDGRNLSNPEKASGKLANKTDFLDEILGYPVGERRYGQSTHKVSIEYYPPRGDQKESWDVIDFTGLFGMPMTIRLNMQLRDSILAAPMIIDLAIWMNALSGMGRTGLVTELAFYFKKAIAPASPIAFQDQIEALRQLQQDVINDSFKKEKTGETLT